MINLENLQQRVHESVQHQGICKKCFMNGKSCSYLKEIEAVRFDIGKRRPEQRINKAFVVMPFRGLLNEVYRTQLEPHLLYSCAEVKRADDVTMTGFVICEKICRQIQEASLVVAELTHDNANVFYELGLAYALNRHIAIFIQDELRSKRTTMLTRLNIAADACNFYKPFTELKTPETRVWNQATHRNEPENSEQLRNPVVVILGDPAMIEEGVSLASEEHVASYSLNGICAGAIHKAISKVETELKCEGQSDRITIHLQVAAGGGAYAGGIRRGAETRPIQIQTAADIERHIRLSRCVVICASMREPSTYFWMGFAHGLEKNVIPVTVDIPPVGASDSKRSMRLPFDVRALWHVDVSRDNLHSLQGQMESIYKVILEKGKDTVQRREFWDEILGSGSVSIFVGSVEYVQANKRHVVGEWDYRTVSEVVSYLNSARDSMETVIQTPIFQASQAFKTEPELVSVEIERLKRMLCEKRRNAVIVGSSDVNDMTDYALALYAGVQPFQPSIRSDKSFSGVVGFKHRGQYKTYETESIYFQWLDEPVKGAKKQRGFYDVHNGDRIGANPNAQYASDTDHEPGKDYECIYSHLAKFRLDDQTLILIQGISGPATLGLAQLLTGARFRQFTAFEIDAASSVKDARERLIRFAEMERIRELQELLKESDGIPDIGKYSEQMVSQLNNVFRSSKSVEAVVQVFVMKEQPASAESTRAVTHDQRKILWWRYAFPPRSISSPKRKSDTTRVAGATEVP